MARKRSYIDFAEEPVSVKVSREPQQIFKPSLSVLANNSKVFQAVFSERWQTNIATAIDCTYISVETFNIYANWCDFGDIDTILGTLEDPTDDRCLQKFHLLTEIYLVADVLDDKALWNTVVDRVLDLAEKTGCRPGDGTIMLAYSDLPESSTLCLYLLNDALSGTCVEWLKASIKRLPDAHLDELLALRLGQGIERQDCHLQRPRADAALHLSRALC